MRNYWSKLRAAIGNLSMAWKLGALDEIADPAQRRLAAFPLLAQIVHHQGFEIYNQSLAWMNDQEFWPLWSGSPFLGKQRADRKFLAWSLAMATSPLDGDTAECGVLDGATSYLILSASQALAPQKEHFMFDSWEGLSEPSVLDKDLPADAAFRWKKGDLCVPEAVALENLSRFGRKTSLKGWIPDRFADVADRRFSFVHIDVDLYQPTRDSLEFFYERVVPGGVILCDDYGSEACPGARRAFDEFARSVPEKFVIHLPTGQGMLTKLGAGGGNSLG